MTSGAAGATGSIVGQLAKLNGCRVVGIAGGAEKCSYVVDELGFASAVDYKAPGLRTALAQACPDGIDVYFDNVGGEHLEAAIAAANASLAAVNSSGYLVELDGLAASLAASLAAGLKMVTAAELAAVAITIVTRKAGIAVVRDDELIEALTPTSENITIPTSTTDTSAMTPKASGAKSRVRIRLEPSRRTWVIT